MKQFSLLIIIGCIFFAALYTTYVAAPSHFPVPYHLTVSPDETLGTISQQLATDQVIKSPRVFRLWMRILGADKKISEGEYSFDQPLSSLGIALRMSGKDFGIAKNKVTFPEGFTTIDMARHLQDIFPNFDSKQFLLLAKNKQGYLFPNTYGFFPTPLPMTVIDSLQQQYEKKVGPLRPDIAATGHTESDIIIMASLIEKEAYGDNDRAIIAGILWNRINHGMALQVDAAPSTYSRKGLPSSAICNPGLAAIQAAITPVSSSFVYYLHDSSGTIHYASTYSEHQQNIKKYLQ
jgi:UPF0755 protein